MKVLKNNYNESLGKINRLNIKSYPRKIECENCQSELEYEEDDINIGVYGAAHVLCPLCGYNNMLDGNENDVLLTKDNIEFPTHFHHTSKETGAVDICDTEHIRKGVKDAINYFRENKDEFCYYTESGNLHITVFRFDGDAEYQIIVTDNYYSTIIPFGLADYKDL